MVDIALFKLSFMIKGETLYYVLRRCIMWRNPSTLIEVILALISTNCAKGNDDDSKSAVAAMMHSTNDYPFPHHMSLLLHHS